MQPCKDSVAIVDHAIVSRRSIRRFRTDTITLDTLRAILSVASRAPSSTNTQPWQVIILRGAEKDALSMAVLEAFHNDSTRYRSERAYYPEKYKEPYLSRRRKLGWDLYGALGIQKGEKAMMRIQHGRNFRFFDAPVGMIFTIDREMEIGSWLDYGMFLQTIAIAARGRGLDTCIQAAFADYHEVIRECLRIPHSRTVVCGMSIGVADTSAPENRFSVERESVDKFASFVGF